MCLTNAEAVGGKTQRNGNLTLRMADAANILKKSQKSGPSFQEHGC
jgi:hypothetical protein